jgi:hypothetical protein
LIKVTYNMRKKKVTYNKDVTRTKLTFIMSFFSCKNEESHAFLLLKIIIENP